ncbi:FAD-dependent oxidoreductase [Paenibacillus sp. strain BS8-2]
MAQSKGKVVATTLLLVAVIMGVVWLWTTLLPDTVQEHQEVAGLALKTSGKESYDVIVAGSDPEGVAAALSAARNGLSVLLVDGKGRDKLGGLLTLGWLNSLDLNIAPLQSEEAKRKGNHEFLNKGIFQEWYDRIGNTSFDVNEAAAAFGQMVHSEPNITLLLGVKSMVPLMSGQTVTGLVIKDKTGASRTLRAQSVIDATQDGDIAALSGVPYTIGHEDLGNPEARMAVTLIFKMSGMTDEIWQSIGQREDTGIDRSSAWGFPSAKAYKSSSPDRIALRGLNIGRQNDGTILINAMHLFGVDPLDPASAKEAWRLGSEEAPRIVEYLKKTYKEMQGLTFAGVAPELYIRESRHIQGEYRLTMADVMENRDHWDAIAYGSYDVDIQRSGRGDYGAIMMSPQQYGIPFRSLVPKHTDGLLVVGRAASFDSLPHGSARVVPLGMATGEAAGAAAKLAQTEGLSFRQLSSSRDGIAKLREQLQRQGMDLAMRELEQPSYRNHKTYPGLLAAVSMGMTLGGYDNKRWDLDGLSSKERYFTMMQRLAQMHERHFQGKPERSLREYIQSRAPLQLEDAVYALLLTAGVQVKRDHAIDELKARGWISPDTWSLVTHPGGLTNGETFMLVRDAAAHYAGVIYR